MRVTAVLESTVPHDRASGVAAHLLSSRPILGRIPARCSSIIVTPREGSSNEATQQQYTDHWWWKYRMRISWRPTLERPKESPSAGLWAGQGQFKAKSSRLPHPNEQEHSDHAQSARVATYRHRHRGHGATRRTSVVGVWVIMVRIVSCPAFRLGVLPSKQDHYGEKSPETWGRWLAGSCPYKRSPMSCVRTTVVSLVR